MMKKIKNDQSVHFAFLWYLKLLGWLAIFQLLYDSSYFVLALNLVPTQAIFHLQCVLGTMVGVGVCYLVVLLYAASREGEEDCFCSFVKWNRNNPLACVAFPMVLIGLSIGMFFHSGGRTYYVVRVVTSLVGLVTAAVGLVTAHGNRSRARCCLRFACALCSVQLVARIFVVVLEFRKRVNLNSLVYSDYCQCNFNSLNCKLLFVAAVLNPTLGIWYLMSNKNLADNCDIRVSLLDKVANEDRGSREHSFGGDVDERQNSLEKVMGGDQPRPSDQTDTSSLPTVVSGF